MPEINFMQKGKRITMENVKIKSIANYGGHNVNNASVVNLTFTFAYDEMTNYIQLIQLLNENIEIYTKKEKQSIKLGVFSIKNISIDKNGAGKVKFSSMAESVNMETINNLIGEDFIKIMFVANVEVEKEENEDEE
jgi:hypothetical protein